MNGQTEFYSQAAEWVVNTARRRPEALLLMAAGVALMMRGNGTARASSPSSDTYGRAAWDDDEGVRGTARESAADCISIFASAIPNGKASIPSRVQTKKYPMPTSAVRQARRASLILAAARR